METRKKYSRPEIIKVELDRTINLMFYSNPMNPTMMPMADGSKGADTPFSSPFDDKPFS